MSHLNENVKTYHSFHTTLTSPKSLSPSRWKSDFNFASRNYPNKIEERMVHTDVISKEKKYDKYYKRYDHDDLPVKDDSSFNDHSFSEDNNSDRADNRDSLTNSDLDKLELKILRKMSQKLQTEDDSISSLESNIKLFKSTVQQIFDNFYQNMQDFDVYKQKFYEIIERNKGDSLAEMEDFIKDMIRHIGSSNSNFSDNSNATEVSSFRDTETLVKANINEEYVHSNDFPNNNAIHSYKNDNYLTDSTLDGNSSKAAHSKEETLNIYLLSNNPRVEIRMKRSSLLSEINIRDQCEEKMKRHLASAENITKITAKKIQLENYTKQQEQPMMDNYIPVKISYAKKNIYLNEDFVDTDNKETNKFFLFKICNYLCKKLRKN